MPLLDFFTSCAEAAWAKISKNKARQSRFSIVFIIRLTWRSVDMEQ
jgi:hypothetical protein